MCGYTLGRNHIIVAGVTGLSHGIASLQSMCVHTLVKPYHCNQFSKAITQKSNLTRHMWLHTGEKPYHCSQCVKAFSGHTQLTRHLITDPWEKSYPCNQYNKAFSNKSNLTYHVRTHIGNNAVFICFFLISPV